MKINSVDLRLFLLITLMCLFFTCMAQVKRDVVYLKNGSIIKGKVLEIIPNQTIKIETADGSIFIYKLDEVEKTTKEDVKKTRSLKINSEQSFEPTGYFIIAGFGPSISPGTTSSGPNISIRFINGIQINSQCSLGLGIEATSYSLDDKGSSATLVPVFMDTRFYIPGQRIHPMINLQCGYSTVENVSKAPNSSTTPSSSNGGVYVAIGIGTRIFINQNISVIADGGFSFQNWRSYSSSDTSTPKEYPAKTVPSLRLNVGIALSFGKGKVHTQ